MTKPRQQSRHRRSGSLYRGFLLPWLKRKGPVLLVAIKFATFSKIYEFFGLGALTPEVDWNIRRHGLAGIYLARPVDAVLQILRNFHVIRYPARHAAMAKMHREHFSGMPIARIMMPL